MSAIGTKRTSSCAAAICPLSEAKGTSLLAISQTQDVRDDVIGVIVFDHEVWH